MRDTVKGVPIFGNRFDRNKPFRARGNYIAVFRQPNPYCPEKALAPLASGRSWCCSSPIDWQQYFLTPLPPFASSRRVKRSWRMECAVFCRKVRRKVHR